MKKDKGWEKVSKEMPEEIVAVHKLGDYWNWRKFRKEPVRFMCFTKKDIYEYSEEL